MSSSRLGIAIDALYARAVAVVGSQAVVVDGAVPTDDPLKKVVVIGWDGSPAGAGGDFATTSEWAQTVAGLGNRRRDETFAINCCVCSWTGDAGQTKARRDEALALLALLEDDLREDPSLGVSPQPFEAEFSNGQLFQEPGWFGQQARIPFTVLIKHDRI